MNIKKTIEITSTELTPLIEQFLSDNYTLEDGETLGSFDGLSSITVNVIKVVEIEASLPASLKPKGGL